MKKFLIIIIGLLAQGCSPSKNESDSGLLAPSAFEAKLKEDSSNVLFDVRTPEELQTGYIEGAMNLDFNSPGFQSGLDTLDHSKKYFVYCASGKRSGKAAAMMKEKGFKDITTMDGGINAWKAAGLPVHVP